MPIKDVAAMNRSLDNDYGTTHGANAPASHLLMLYAGDPMVDGTELDASDNPGYARAPVAAGDWADADAGSKTAEVSYADADDEWSETATHWALLDGDDETTVWDCAQLDTPLDVTAAGPGPVVTVTVFYDDAITLP